MRSRLFPMLALTTVLFTIGLIVFGAVVRVTDSGLGCGNQWPLCDGTIIPPLDNITAWIEWLHRLFAALIGVFGLAMLTVAIRAYRKNNRRVLMVTAIAAILFVVQSGLGALVVIYDLPPTSVTLHLGTAMLLLGALLAAGIEAIYIPKQVYNRDSFTGLAYITTALALVIILTGALVRGSGATLACVDWPLCNGDIVPVGQGQLANIHMLHRFAVLGLGVALVMLVWSAWSNRRARTIRLLSVLGLSLYGMQAGVGALFVLTRAEPIWGASHVGLAAATWAALVALCVIEASHNRGLVDTEQSWRPQSELLPKTQQN